MPPVYIEFLPRTITEEVAESLKAAIRLDAARRFSVSGRQLSGDDFTINFIELKEWSEPSHDIIVRVQLHHDPERLKNDKHETDAQEMADVIAGVISDWYGDEDVTIGVALLYAEVAWATATATPERPAPTDR